MKRTIVKFRNSPIRQFIKKHNKYAALLFFIGGFIFDTLTLGRIDRTYDLVLLCLYMTLLPITIYLFNLSDDGKWKNTLLNRYEDYFPLAIQFFFGGLISAYVIYFSRSVSLSKSISFFIILVALLFANNFLKKRISNKYLQFSVFFFVNFTFFTFIIPVFIKVMNTYVFVASGLISLIFTLSLLLFIYKKSPSTRQEISIKRMISIIVIMYITINSFYIFNLIPPVPLALDTGIVAHNVKVEKGHYTVTYEKSKWFYFWRDHKITYNYTDGQPVYIFTSIFAPTDIKKTIFHRWKKYNPNAEAWEFVEDIGYNIIGGRDSGFRGYTYKNNVSLGLWKVEVITEEELVIGIVDFEIINNSRSKNKLLVTKRF
jgi:hypothetical protein